VEVVDGNDETSNKEIRKWKSSKAQSSEGGVQSKMKGNASSEKQGKQLD